MDRHAVFFILSLFSVSINLPAIDPKPLGPPALVPVPFKAVAAFDLSLVFETAALYFFFSAPENPKQLLLTSTTVMV